MRCWKCQAVSCALATPRRAHRVHLDQCTVASCAQRVLPWVRRQEVDVLPADAHRHVRGRIGTLLGTDRSRLTGWTTVDAAVQTVAPGQLYAARALRRRARLQAQRCLVFVPVLRPRANVVVQWDGARGSLETTVCILVVCVAAQAPTLRAWLCCVPRTAVQFTAER